MYCLYAFGLPVLITTLVFSADKLIDLPDNFKIGMGRNRCWINSNMMTELTFVFGPVSALLIFNIAFYTITAYKIHAVQNQSQIKGDNVRHVRVNAEKMRFENSNHDSKPLTHILCFRFLLYLRLFVIMGVTWLFEIISWVFDEKLTWILYIVDILNCLQGLIIFMFFIWQPKIKKMFVRR